MKLALQAMSAVRNLVILGTGVIHLGHAAGEGLNFAFHVAQIVEHGHAFLKDATSGKREAVLREIPGANSFHYGNRAVVESFQSGEHFEESGFSRAVRAHQPDAVAGCDEPVEIFEENRAEALAGGS